MGKKRLEGQHCRLLVRDADGKETSIGEVSKLTVKTNSELRKSRSIGEAENSSSLTFEGYELSFEGGKVDWKAAALLHQQDIRIVEGERTPYFVVEQTFKYFGKKGEDHSEVHKYEQVTIYGYEIEVDANSEIQEKFSGYCGKSKSVTPLGLPQTENQTVINKIDAMIEAALKKDGNIV